LQKVLRAQGRGKDGIVLKMRIDRLLACFGYVRVDLALESVRSAYDAGIVVGAAMSCTPKIYQDAHLVIRVLDLEGPVTVH